MEKNKKERPTLKALVSFLSPIQKEYEVPSSVLMGLQHGGGKDMLLSPLGEACRRKDLTTMHKMLENLEDEEVTATEVYFLLLTATLAPFPMCVPGGFLLFPLCLFSFSETLSSFKIWINMLEILDTINSKQMGDVAFRNKDFKGAIKSYTKFIDATILARRSLSYLMSDSPREAQEDAIKAQNMIPTWHVALYLQAAAFFAVGEENKGQIALRHGSLLEKLWN